MNWLARLVSWIVGVLFVPLRFARSRFAVLTLVALLTLSGLAFSAHLNADSALANAAGVSISGCSYAYNYCSVYFTLSCNTTITAIWYTNIGGYNASNTVQYGLLYAGNRGIFQWVGSNERADQVVIYANWGYCLQSIYYVGVGF